jgi:hypothetical protein
MVYARNQCMGDDDIQCGDNYPAEPDLVSFPVGGAQPVYLVVDGYQMDAGDFTLHLDLSTGDGCSDPVPILIGDDGGLTEHALGGTTGKADDAQGTCVVSLGTPNADVVYAITRMATGTVTENTTAMNGLNSVTYARSTCTSSGTELACSSPLTSNNSNVTLDDVGSTPVYLWIDGNGGQSGGYNLSFHP